FHPNQALEQGFEIGNVGLALKRYLVKGDRWNLTGGLGLQLPTAPATNLTYDATLHSTWNDLAVDLHEVLNVRQSNQTVWLNPFLGVSYDGHNRLFAQGMVQLCVPLSESTASLSTSVNGTIKLFGSTLFDLNQYQSTSIAMAFETLFRANVDLGCWLYQNPGGRVSSLAAILEIDDTNAIGNIFSANVVNLGPQLVMNVGNTEFDTGMLIPVTADQAYKWEYVFRVNRRF
ncbi:MAG: hypothetical protein ABR915_17730, partial [Thermoguttaceae bacterium]